MAVQKSRKSRSRRGMRCAHHALDAPTLTTNPVTGELHPRHEVTATGYHRDKPVPRLMAAIERRYQKKNNATAKTEE